MNLAEKRPLSMIEEARLRHAQRKASVVNSPRPASEQPSVAESAPAVTDEIRAELKAYTDSVPLSNPAPAPAETAAVALKPLVEPDIVCPKCHTVIRTHQRGAYYTECRKCGEIIR